MVTRVKIKDIKVQWLNARCLNVMAKYVKLAYELDNKRIKLGSDSCLVDIVDHVRESYYPELRDLYRELKSELKVLLTADHLQPKLDALQTYDKPEVYDNNDMSYSQTRN